MLYQSFYYIDELGRLALSNYVMDDFVSTTSGQLRAIGWQGGYCDQRFLVPLAVPMPIARSFQITVAEDSGIKSPSATTLLDVALAPADVHQERLFDVLANSNAGCGPKIPASFAYYRYSATLPRPIALSAGRRYWLRLVADVGTTDVIWGWRRGMPDNAYTWLSIPNAYYPVDMAFSATVQP
jgi:hypothetical protein